MALTPQQEKFAQAIADGMNQTDAYKTAYSAENMKIETIYSKASILINNGKVRARIDELKQALTEKALWTRADSVKTMISVIDDQESRATDKVAAVKVLNDMHGFNAPTQVEHNGTVSVNLSIDQAARMAREFIAESK
jgi:phage terminase small subunit